MNSSDDGYFYYDMNTPPLCFKHTVARDVDKDVIQYLQQSYRFGEKHENTLLPCGLTAGEAAMLYFRQLYQKRGKS